MKRWFARMMVTLGLTLSLVICTGSGLLHTVDAAESSGTGFMPIPALAPSSQAPSVAQGCVTKRAKAKADIATTSLELRVRFCWHNNKITNSSYYAPLFGGVDARAVSGPSVVVKPRPGGAREFTATVRYDQCAKSVACAGERTLQVTIIAYPDGSWLWSHHGGNSGEATDNMPPNKRVQRGGAR